jgi:glutamate-1-semialdehyde 2,1-aminomutase
MSAHASVTIAFRRPAPDPRPQPARRAAVPAPVRGLGAAVWDGEGRAYLDLDNQGGAVILGHADAEVEAAMAAPPAGAAEAIAEHLRAFVPCAEAVRLTASEPSAMIAALRVTRAHTGRERVLTCNGRPLAGATAAFSPNDLGQLAALLDLYVDEVAAVVFEPLGAAPLATGHLAAVRDLVHSHGALMVFDETRAGPRVHQGGAQALLGVTPDLAVFGRALGNGAAIAAVAGPQDLLSLKSMHGLPPEEGALGAAWAALRKIEREPVIYSLRVRGAEVQAEVETALRAAGACDLIGVSGDPTWSRLDFRGPRAKAQFLAQARACGLHTTGGHAMSYAHADEAITELVRIYGEVFPRLVEAHHVRVAS